MQITKLIFGIMILSIPALALANEKTSTEKESDCDRMVKTYREGFEAGYEQTKAKVDKDRLDAFDDAVKGRTPCDALENIKPIIHQKKAPAAAGQ